MKEPYTFMKEPYTYMKEPYTYDIRDLHI